MEPDKSLHHELDLGIHLTLTAEWKNYKWGGVSPSTEISSLLNEEGFFYPSVEEVGRYAKQEEVEKEFELNPGDQYAMDFMIFNDTGKYLVKFVDSEGNSLAAKEIEIF